MFTLDKDLFSIFKSKKQSLEYKYIRIIIDQYLNQEIIYIQVFFFQPKYRKKFQLLMPNYIITYFAIKIFLKLGVRLPLEFTLKLISTLPTKYNHFQQHTKYSHFHLKPKTQLANKYYNNRTTFNFQKLTYVVNQHKKYRLTSNKTACRFIRIVRHAGLFEQIPQLSQFDCTSYTHAYKLIRLLNNIGNFICRHSEAFVMLQQSRKVVPRLERIVIQVIQKLQQEQTMDNHNCGNINNLKMFKFCRLLISNQEKLFSKVIFRKQLCQLYVFYYYLKLFFISREFLAFP
eukprot:TRINITY_DN16304_c2_g1_i10.p1 TRINITY_DN16304_c2_g1~~TRINITY_DN16304_c2_g1_i10.p1  ORF type:complete len:288 (-),score=-19.74 TRINITY_DN16304_c2_g1_i10:113-976(-)